LALNSSGNAFIKDICVNLLGELYFVGEEKGKNASEDLIITKLDNLGSVNWQKSINSIYNEKPIGINISNDGDVFITSTKQGIYNTYENIKYSEFKRDTNIIFNMYNEPICFANELIVRFEPSALNRKVIDDQISSKEAEFGSLDFWLDSMAIIDFNNAISNLCISNFQNNISFVNNPCNIQAIKVFKELKTIDTVTTNRLGEQIKIPDFWTTLLLVFPEGMNIEQINNALKTIPNVVRYSEPNYIITSTAGCNDIEYSNQNSLHSTGNFLNSDINIEPAWDIVQDGGANYIKCGVFDSGLDWDHEDFGYDGVDPNSSKVVDGWNFFTNTNSKTSIMDDDTYLGHGTQCGGIIGAIRNNNIGIGGIAGGNINTNANNKGVSLYSLKILDKYTYLTQYVSSLNFVYDAIVTSSIDDPSKKYAYGINLASNSWRYTEKSFNYTLSNNRLIREAVHFANRAQVTFCAARGNEGYDNLALPAIIDDDWVLNVGGTGSDGEFQVSGNGNIGEWSNSASFGHQIDISAPSTKLLVKSLNNSGGYSTFNGTSASTPHIAGVVGLMMSYLNDPIPNYKNLAPEDCEKIIEISATDCQGTGIGYDKETGWGRLNAGNALALIEKPFNQVQHFGTNSLSTFTKSVTNIASNKIIHLLEDYTNSNNQYFPAGDYKVDIYRIDALVNHNISSNENIISYWPRSSSSSLLDNIDINNNLLARERVYINSRNNNNSSLSGYVYDVYRLNNIPIGWWPFSIVANLNSAKFEYTV
jgi:subtilisin family serine protease